MRNNIQNKLKEIISKNLFIDIPQEKIGIEDSLQTVIGLDSICFTELLFQCEQNFNIKISDEDFSATNFENIKVLSEFIFNKLEIQVNNHE